MLTSHAEYYTQRASVPGTLIISEATIVSHRSIGRLNVPGIWSEAQIAAWKEITDAVHAKGCRIFCQLWHLGRAARAEAAEKAGARVVSSSAVATEGFPMPEALTAEEIYETINDYAEAARNAVHRAGFDGVEIHGGTGYLPDQFLQDTCNQRTDGWGGSIEKRARFGVELMTAVAAAVGPDRAAIRLSPFSDFLGMLMTDPYPQFEYLVSQLKPLKLAYLHLIEARIRGNDDASCGEGHNVGFLVKLWDHTSPVLIAGGFTPESAKKAVDETYKDYDVAIVFGRYFVSNPDLVFRVTEGIPLKKYERTYFYTPKLTTGYTDYPFSEEFLAKVA